MPQRPNILLITADDMNWDAVGAYGCPVPGTTPNIDSLAAAGLCFEHAHVTIAVCQPSRSTLMTGRYPHRNGGEGFFRLRTPNIPILPQLLRDGGYRVGILDLVFTQFHQTAARRNYPMRCVQNHRFGYIFNPWSNGTRVFKNESQGGRTMRAMRKAAESDPEVANRVDLFLYRVPKEFYDFENDPDALHNLIDDPKYASEIASMQQQMADWMERTEDPALTAFRHRNSPAALDQLMTQSALELGGES